MKKTLLTILTLLFGFSSFSQVTDIDGNEYKTVKIEGQEWMAENLNVSHFRNGEEIPQAKTKEEWQNASGPVWAYCDFNEENKSSGKLYNWYAITDERGLAPEGYQVPSSKDWQKLSKSTLDNAFRKNNCGGRFEWDGGYIFLDSEKTAWYWINTKQKSDYGWGSQLIGDNLVKAEFHIKAGLSVRCVKQ